MAFLFQGASCRTRARRRRCRRVRCTSALRVALCLFAGSGVRRPSLGRGQFDARAPGLRKTDGYRLFGRSSAVFAFSNMLDFFPNELAGLRRRRFSLAGVLARASDGCFIRHDRPPADIAASRTPHR
jgi:hypothetical protein